MVSNGPIENYDANRVAPLQTSPNGLQASFAIVSPSVIIITMDTIRTRPALAVWRGRAGTVRLQWR